MNRWLCCYKGIILMLILTLALARTSAQVAAAERAAELEAKPKLQLSLKRAVEIALAPEGSVRVQLATELTKQARARSAQARAALLPNLDSSVNQQNRTVNLAALGIQIPIPGFQLPRLVGPFTTFDARATMSQSILDISAIRRLQASRAGVRLAEGESESTQDQVAAQVAKLYVAALRAEDDLATAKANMSLSEALLKLARDQKAAGTGTGIDVTRAQVQLANERQRLLVAEVARTRAHLELLRAMGIGFDTDLELVDRLEYVPNETLTVKEAVATALRSRADLKAQERREENARLNYSATKLERLPALVGFADYGTIGSSIEHALPTRTYGASVRLPLFDGGRRDARRAENRSQLEQERIRTSDLRQQIELEVRVALENLRSAEDQVAVAREGLQLSQNELAQARRRYEAGVGTSIEVTDAQTRLERSRDNQTTALFSYNMARYDLGLAMGVIRRLLR